VVGMEEILSNEYARFFIIFIGTLIIVSLSYLVLRVIINKIAGRKKTYGRFILKKLSIPLLTVIFFLGLFFDEVDFKIRERARKYPTIPEARA